MVLGPSAWHKALTLTPVKGLAPASKFDTLKPTGIRDLFLQNDPSKIMDDVRQVGISAQSQYAAVSLTRARSVTIMHPMLLPEITDHAKFGVRVATISGPLMAA